MRRLALFCGGFAAGIFLAQYLLPDSSQPPGRQSTLKLLGSKGTTGTQASFLELFEGDQETIDKIDPMIAAKMGFKVCVQLLF